MSQLFDIAVLGATPAGLAAAHYLAAKGLEVVLVDSPRQSTESPLADWVPQEFFRLPGLPKTLARDCGAAAFAGVVYQNAALDRTVEHKMHGQAGYFLRAQDLTAALRTSARRVGVKIRQVIRPPAIRLGEDHVTLDAQSAIQARILLLAQNRPNDIIGELALPVRTLPHSSLVVAGLDVPLRDKAAARRHGGKLSIIELPERSDLGMFFVFDQMVHLRLISASVASGTRAAELSALVVSLQNAGLLPGELVLSKAHGAVWWPPAGVALELETHVAKRCLLVGTAGGFAETLTGQTIHPSIQSALIGAGVAVDALNAPDTQEAMMAFKTSWRKALAEYLRPPNTSLRMLLPLLFVNQKILSKFTRALLYGENI